MEKKWLQEKMPQGVWMATCLLQRSELVLGILSPPYVGAAAHLFVVVTLTNSEIWFKIAAGFFLLFVLRCRLQVSCVF